MSPCLWSCRRRLQHSPQPADHLGQAVVEPDLGAEPEHGPGLDGVGYAAPDVVGEAWHRDPLELAAGAAELEDAAGPGPDRGFLGAAAIEVLRHRLPPFQSPDYSPLRVAPRC